jgi:hypothetical protein
MSTQVRLKTPWKRRLLLAAGVLFVLLVALYFALTSTTFVRQFVLPRVGDFLGAEITVGDTSLHPLSSFTLRDLRVQAAQHDPILEVGELRVRYDGRALLRGRLVVTDCAVISPRVHLVREADGRNNLPTRLAQRPAADRPADRPRPGGRAPEISLRHLALTNLLVRVVDRDRAGTVQTTTVSNLTLQVDRVENGAPGRLTLATALRLDRRPAGGTATDHLGARTEGRFDFELTPALVLGRLAGNARLEVTDAGGALANLAALQARLETLLEGTTLSQCTLTFDQRGTQVGTAHVSGTFDPARNEGQLRVKLDSINRQVLNLFAAPLGLEFQRSAIGADVLLGLTQNGRTLTAQGQVVANQLAVRRADAVTPAVDGEVNFDLRAEQAAQRLHVQKFQLSLRQGAAELLAGKLDYPLEFSWATNVASSFTKATLGLHVQGLNLAEWRALHGQTNLAGRCDARLGLTTVPGDPRLQLAADLTLRDILSGTARQQQLEIKLQAAYAVSNRTDSLAGRATLRLPGAANGDMLPAGLEAETDFQLARDENILVLRQLLTRASRDQQPAGTISLEGNYSPKTQTGQLHLKVAAVNERLLAPLLDAALAPRRLASASFDATAALQLRQPREGSLEADLTLSRFALSAPGAPATSPLGATARFSATSSGDVHQIKRLVLNLAPGAPPPNEVELTGLLDVRADKPDPSRLTLKAATLDLTPWWDALAPAPPAAAPASPPTAAPPRNDPAPLRPPVQQFVLDARVDRLTARQLVLSNLVLGARLSEGLLAVKPFEATLNGAPVRALLDANLGVPGWLYNVDLALDRVPLRPLVESFAPAGTPAAAGELTLNGEIKGAGFSDDSLRSKLNGRLNLALTNAAVPLAQGWKQGVLEIVATLLRVPELAGAPVAWASGALSLGGGQVDLSTVQLGTEAMIAGLSGRIPLAPVLTNSPLDLPVTLQLRRSLAQRAKLTVGGDPATPFAPLPDFLRVKGTLGQPRADINKLALGGVLLQSLGGLPAVGGEKTGAILQGIGGLLAPPPAGGTNAPATNRPPPVLPFLPRRP